MGEPVELRVDECRALLAPGGVGRVAITTPSGPRIVPVNFVMVDDAIVFRTTPYSELGTYGWRGELAFETDQLDFEHQLGWSVVAVGRAEVVEDPDEVADIHSGVELSPWAGGHRHLYFRLRWRDISGRRLVEDRRKAAR
jgi:uncharacterized protein